MNFFLGRNRIMMQWTTTQISLPTDGCEGVSGHLSPPLNCLDFAVFVVYSWVKTWSNSFMIELPSMGNNPFRGGKLFPGSPSRPNLSLSLYMDHPKDQPLCLAGWTSRVFLLPKHGLVVQRTWEAKTLEPCRSGSSIWGSKGGFKGWGRWCFFIVPTQPD